MLLFLLVPRRSLVTLTTSQRHVATTAPRMHVATYHAANPKADLTFVLQPIGVHQQSRDSLMALIAVSGCRSQRGRMESL